MSTIATVGHQPDTIPKGLVQGFLFWVAFLLVLEPGNIARAARVGYRLSFEHEALRILVAACLGAAVTPAVLYMTGRFPMIGTVRWRHAAFHAMGTAGMACVLIVVSCFFSTWGFERRWLPSLEGVREQLVSNWTLLVFALAFFTVIAHAIRFSRATVSTAAAPEGEKLLRRIPFKSRGRQGYVDIERVDWIEAQGNYVALHVGASMHLIRDTLENLERQIDARRFVRIHRRVIVAVDRIEEIKAEGNGDATLRLTDGRELRASRRHRKVIRDRWAGTLN
jgi:LytTr DNA-binding domain